jgi:PKD repeat protein
VNATDPDGDALTYSASGLPAGATFDPATKQFSWTPDYTQAGDYTVTFTASDGTNSYSLSGTKTVSISVADVDRPPVFAPGGESQSVDENRELSFTVEAADPDGDGLTYSAAGLPAGATFDPATRTFSWTPGYTQAGDYTVVFTAEDSGHAVTLSATKSVSISVRDVTVSEQLAGLKTAVAAAPGLNGGLKNALTVKLDQAAKLLGKGKTADAVSILRDDFIPQVHALAAAGKLTAAEEAALVTGAQEAIENITS